jgi:hypothetical protein
MLDVPKLKILATKKLEMQLKNWVIADFPPMVKETYSSTTIQDGEIRDLLVATSKDHIDELVLRGDFKIAMEEFGEFSAALVVAISGRVVEKIVEKVVEKPAQIRCSNCDSTGSGLTIHRCDNCY